MLHFFNIHVNDGDGGVVVVVMIMVRIMIAMTDMITTAAMRGKKKSETELTASVLEKKKEEKRSKTHKRLKEKQD